MNQGVTRWSRRLPMNFNYFCRICLGLFLLTQGLRAVDFPLGGTLVPLTDVSARTEVTFRSLRMNPVLGVWNTEILVRNTGNDPLPTPLVVVAGSWTGTTGPRETDDSGAAGGPGPFWNLTAQVTGGALAPGATTRSRLITLGPVAGESPRLLPRVFARLDLPAMGSVFGFARALDASGLPLGSVQVTQHGPSGDRVLSVDTDAGVVTLGGTPGTHVWRFESPGSGHLPAWLQATLVASVPSDPLRPRIQPLPPLRLTLRSTKSIRVTAAPTTVASDDETIELRFPANALEAAADVTLTPLGEQALPMALPGGWSPRQAFWWETSKVLRQPITARLVPRGAIPAGAVAAWVRFDESMAVWRVVQTVILPAAGSVVVRCDRPGAYALLGPDAPPTVPPAPVAGQALSGVPVPVPDASSLIAEGRVTPPVAAASTNPVLVTARGEIQVRRAGGPLPSGTRMRCEIAETYRLINGQIRTTPGQEMWVTLFRAPGDVDAGRAQAEFPLRPRLLLGGDRLAEATVQVRVLVPEGFDGGILLPGGAVTLGRLSLRAPDGALSSSQAVRGRSLPAEPGIAVRFEIEVSGVTTGRSLEVDFQPVLPDGNYVLVRNLVVESLLGAEPVARLQVRNGRVTQLETGNASGLPGLTRSGQYSVHAVSVTAGVVTGTVQRDGGQAAVGLPVRVDGQPWLVFTDATGRYRTLAPPGPVEISVVDSATLAGGRREFTMPDSLDAARQDLTLGNVAPRIATVTPANLAVDVPLLAPVVVTFSKPLSNPIPDTDPVLLQTEAGLRVPARVRFDPDATGVRLYPSNQLAELMRYTVVVSPTLVDATGQTLAGPTTFSFATRTNVFTQKPGSQLYSEAPGSNGLARVIGTAGFAQPRQPVLFVNDTTGETATLDAKADGSFANSIPAAENDRLRIVLVNTDGSRTEVPVGRQVFPDGSVALYSGGGSFAVVGNGTEIRGATVEIPPGATLGRTKLKLELRPLTELPTISQGVPPADGAPIGLFRFTVEGDPLRVPATLRFELDPVLLEAQLAAAPGTNDPILVAAVPRKVEQLGENGPTEVLAYDYLGSLKPVSAEAGAATIQGARGGGSARRHFSPSWILEGGGTGALDALLFGVRLWPNFEIKGLTISADLNGSDIVVGSEVPLAGAVVRGRAHGGGNTRPLSLQPGELYSTSDNQGLFLMLAPTRYQGGNPPLLTGYTLVATHPAFPRQFAADDSPNLINPSHPFVVGRLAFDRLRPPDTTPPSITISHLPTAPDAGTPVTLRIAAADEAGQVRVLADLDGPPPTNAQVTLRDQGGGFWRLECDRQGKVTIKVSAIDGFGNRSQRAYAVTFGLPLPQGPLPDDALGPWVVAAQPDENAVGVPTAAALSFLFSERVHGDIVTNPATYLTLLPRAGTPRASFGRDQREVIISYPAVVPDTAYTLSIQNVRDGNGQILDQNPDPASPAAEPFVLNFRTAPVVQTNLPGVTEGGGVVLRGAVAYVLDRVGKKINVYDLSVPKNPRLITDRFLPGAPRALTLIPDYSYVVDFANPGQPGPTPSLNVLRSDVLAVSGTLPGGGYLRLYDPQQLIEDPALVLNASPLGGTVFNLDETALITRLVWSAPYLVAVENSLGGPALRVINLQGTLLAGAYFDLTPPQFATLPFHSIPPRDANGDGDFVDPGDAVPQLGRDQVNFSAGETDLLTLGPNRPPVGNESIILSDTSRVITDAVVVGSSGFVGALVTPGRDVLVTLRNGQTIETNHVEKPGSFRGMVVGQLLPDANSVNFPGYYPKRAVLVNQDLRQLAVVNLITIDSQENKLAIIDCSRPDAVHLANEIPFPRAEFGLLQGAEVDGTGRIVLSTVLGVGGTFIENFVILDPRRLLDPARPGEVHPAILGSVSGAGGGVAPFVSRRSGINVVSLRGQNVVTQTSPLIRFVEADPTWTDLFRAGDLNSRLAEFLALRELELLPVTPHGTASSLIPGDPTLHFQVMAELPGGAGREISLALLSLDGQGQVVSRPNNAQPPAFIARLPLRRLSDVPSREGFNVYLSSPIALVPQDLQTSDVQDANARHPRHILIAGDRLRVGIPAVMQGNAVLGAFSGTGDVARAGDSNPPLIRLGVSQVRPVLNLQFAADDRLRLRTEVDWVNTNTCPGHVRLHFSHTVDCEITLMIDGQPVRGISDDLGRTHAVATAIPSTAGSHWFQLDTGHVGDPGMHTFELTAEKFGGLPTAPALVERGEIEHEVEINHNYPIGHTLIQGVDIWDGHLTHSEQDVMIPGRRLNLEFARSYSSAGNSSSGPIGAGWTHSYHIRVVADSCGKWTVIGGEGSGNAFTLPRVNAGQAHVYAPLLADISLRGRFEFFKPQIGFHSTLVRDSGQPTNLWFFTKSGVRYHFSTEPKLSVAPNTVFTIREVREPNGNELRFQYQDNDPDPATLDTVTEFNASPGLPALLKRGFRFSYQNIAHEPRVTELLGFNQQGSPDLMGLRITFDYDAAGNLIACTRAEPDGSRRRTSYGYTPATNGPLAHNLTSVTNANGNLTLYTYLPSAFLGYYAAGVPLADIPAHEIVQSVRRVGAAQGVFEATTDAVTRFTYDWRNFIRKVSDSRGQDSFGQTIPDTEYTVNSWGATTRIVAPLGQVTEMRWATDAPLDLSVTDGAGNPVRDVLMTYKKDAEEQEHFYEFKDGRGNLTRERIVPSARKAAIRNALGAAVNDLVVTSAYDAVFSARTNHVDAEGNATRSVIDPGNGNTLRITDAEGNTSQFSYHRNGDLRERHDPRGFKMLYSRYDLYGNGEWIRSEVESGGRTVDTENRFDERSRMRETFDTFGHHQTMDYDGLDRVIATTRLNDRSAMGVGPLSTGPDSTSRTAYLPGGEVLRSTNPLGLISQFHYDTLGRNIRTEQRAVRQNDGSVSNYVASVTYDPAGNTVAETDARGVIRTHFIDALNRRVRTDILGTFGPNLTLSRAGYDRVGNLTNTVDLHGFTTRFEQDGLYRVVATHLPFTNSVPFGNVPLGVAVIRSVLDRVGTVRSSIDANGNLTLHEYDRIYRLKKTTDPEGNIAEYDYDGAGNRLLEIQRSSGLQIVNTFDGLNRRTSSTRTGPGLPPGGYVMTTQYNDALNEVSTTNPRGFLSTMLKDGLDRMALTVVDATAPNGLQLTNRFTYDAAGNVLTQVDPQNGDIDARHSYDSLGRRLQSTYVADADGVEAIETTNFDANGNTLATRDRRGLERRMNYDNLNRPRLTELREDLSNQGSWLSVSEVEYNDAANTIKTYDARRNPTLTQNDSLGRPARMTDALQQTASVTHDALNKRTETDRKGQRREFTYDRLNRVLTTVERDIAGVAQTRSEMVYQDASRLHLAIDRRGLTNRTHFDALGRVVRTERSGGDTATRYFADPLILETKEYDGNNNLVTSIDARGNQVRHEYDGVDRKVATIEGFGSAVVSTTRMIYDGVGNLLEAKDGRVTGATFDVQHTYDRRYRKLSSANALGQTSQFKYDDANNLVQTTEPLGGITRYVYDEMNALLEVDESLRASSGSAAGITRFRLDANRNKLAQQDASGNLVTYAYDALNRLTNTLQHLVVPPAINSRTHAPLLPPGATLPWVTGYDPNNNQSFIRDPRGQEVTLTYDHLNRLISRDYSHHAETNGAGIPLQYQVLKLTYAYDGNGNPTNSVELKRGMAGDITERTASQFDALDRLAVKTRFDFDDLAGRRLAFAYDAVGNRTQVVDSDLRTNNYAYDARNRLNTVTLDPGPGALQTTYHWEADNLLQRLDLPGGAFAERGYDPADRVLTITNGGPVGALFSAFTYAYDDNGNRISQAELQPVVGPGLETTTYQYDRLNRLTNVVYGAASALSFNYAANGNRLGESGTDPISGAVVNRKWHYTELPGKFGTTFSGVNTLTRIEDLTPAAAHIDYEYDRNLNQVSRLQGGGTNRFRFDIRDQMIEAQTGAVVARFDYNGDRLRAKKLASGGGAGTVPETRYLYDQSAVLIEYDGTPAHETLHKYDYGHALLALGAPTAPGGPLDRDFYQHDGLGSTANLVTSVGTHTHSYRYDAWGRLRAQAGTGDNRRQYTGHYRDAETGLHYFGARYYDDEQARFVSQDPYLGEAGTPPSLHRFLYAYANPLRFVDLTGYANVDTVEFSEEEAAPIIGKPSSNAELKYDAWKIATQLRKDHASPEVIEEYDREEGTFRTAAYWDAAGPTLVHGGLGAVIGFSGGAAVVAAEALGLGWFATGAMVGGTETASQQIYRGAAGIPMLSNGEMAAGVLLPVGFGGLGNLAGMGKLPFSSARSMAKNIQRIDEIPDIRPVSPSTGLRSVAAPKTSAAVETQFDDMADKTIEMTRDYRTVIGSGRGKVDQLRRYFEMGALEGWEVTPRFIANQAGETLENAPWGLYEPGRQGRFLINEEVRAISPAQLTDTTYHEASHALDEVRKHVSRMGLKPDSPLLRAYNPDEAKQFLTFNEEMRAQLTGVRAAVQSGQAGESHATELLRTKGLPGLSDFVISAYKLDSSLIYFRYPKLRPQ